MRPCSASARIPARTREPTWPSPSWQLGEVGPARALIEEAVAHAIETGHVPTLVLTYFNKALFEIVCGDAGAARRDTEIVVELDQENALTALSLAKLYQATGRSEAARELLAPAVAGFTEGS